MATRLDALAFAFGVALTLTGTASAQVSIQTNVFEQNRFVRLSDGHPDLSGYWWPGTRWNPNQLTPAQVLSEGLKNLPPYKAQYLEKVKELYGRVGYADPTWRCVPPGLPRVGAPYLILQQPGMVLLIYTDSGTDYVGKAVRVVYTDGRTPPPGNDPSFYGDSVGHWEGDTLVVEARNFVTSSWMGTRGEIHSDQMRVVERFTRLANKIHYEVTVYDPVMLQTPWTEKPFDLVPADVPLIESPPCVPRATDPDAILEQRAIESRAAALRQGNSPTRQH